MTASLNQELEFEEQINGKDDRALMEWTAKQVFYQQSKLDKISNCQDGIENRLLVVETKIKDPEMIQSGMSRKERIAYTSGAGAGGIALLAYIIDAVIKVVSK